MTIIDLISSLALEISILRRSSLAIPVLEQLRLFILDVLRHDEAEQVPSIVRLLNDDGGVGWRDAWPHDFTVEEVVPALEQLLAARHISLLREPDTGDGLDPLVAAEVSIIDDQDHLWFALTDEGRQAWSRWNPPQT